MDAKTLRKRAEIEGNPVIDGEKATFFWEGTTAPLLLGDFNNWAAFGSEPVALEKIDKNTWAVTLTFTPEAYVEYAFFTAPSDEDTRRTDPLNKRRVTNGLGGYNNWFDMPAARHTKLIRAKKGIARGTITRHKLTDSWQLFIGNSRDVWLYQPPVEEPVPLLVVYDGRDYLRRAKLPQIVDNLIAQKRIRPLALAMVHNSGRHRMGEYHTSEATLHMVMQGILPLAQEHLNLISTNDEPGAYGVLGASMGGLMALYTGLRLPKIFGHVISQSGAFAFSYPQAESDALINILIKTLPRQEIKIWQDVGNLEWLLEFNRQMKTLLESCGYDVTYRENPAGHNYTAWRDLLPDALETLYGVEKN